MILLCTNPLSLYYKYQNLSGEAALGEIWCKCVGAILKRAMRFLRYNQASDLGMVMVVILMIVPGKSTELGETREEVTPKEGDVEEAVFGFAHERW